MLVYNDIEWTDIRDGGGCAEVLRFREQEIQE